MLQPRQPSSRMKMARLGLLCAVSAMVAIAFLYWHTEPPAPKPQISLAVIGRTNSPTQAIFIELANNGSQAVLIVARSMKSRDAAGHESIRTWEEMGDRLPAGESVQFSVPAPTASEPWKVRFLVLSETPRLRVLNVLRRFGPGWLYQRIERHPWRGVTHTWLESEWIEP